MPEKNQNVQDVFLNKCRKDKQSVTVFLVNGVKLQGVVSWFDNFSLLLGRDSQQQLVYKHAISTIMPSGPLNLRDDDDEEGGAEKPARREPTVEVKSSKSRTVEAE